MGPQQTAAQARATQALRRAVSAILTETWHEARWPASTTVNQCGRTRLSGLALAQWTVASKPIGDAALGAGRAGDGSS
jgi:hypothetical protein